MPIDDTVDPWDPDDEGCLKPGYEQCAKCGDIFDVEMHPKDGLQVKDMWLCWECIEEIIEKAKLGQKGEGNATV